MARALELGMSRVFTGFPDPEFHSFRFLSSQLVYLLCFLFTCNIDTTYGAMIKVLHHKALFRLLITGVKKGRLHCWTSRPLRSSGVPWFQGPERRVYHRSTGAKGSPWISRRKRRYSKNHRKKFRSILMKVHRLHEWSNEKDC